MTRIESKYGVQETIDKEATTGQVTLTINVGVGVFELDSASIYTACTAAGVGVIYFEYSNLKGGNDEQYLVSGYFNEKNPLCLNAPTKLIGPGKLKAYYEVPVSATSKFSAMLRRVYQ